MASFIPRTAQFWREEISSRLAGLRSRADRVRETIRLYELGYAGAVFNPESQAELNQLQQQASGYVCGSDLATGLGFADSGKGKLAIPWLAQAVLFPGSFPGAGQERGDCVSHGGAGAAAITIANEIWTGGLDEQSGQIESVPDGPAVWREGVISSAHLWWTRRGGGDGWYCPAVVKNIMSEGMILMRDYPELGIDFSDYSRSLTAQYARSGPPANVAAVAKQHTIRESIEADTMEATRDLLYAGHGIVDCGNQGWSSSRDANGVSRRRGSWAHSMKEAAFDDRPWAWEKYGEPLLLIINNWGAWNSGPRDIYDSAGLVPASLRESWIKLDIVNPQTGNIMIPQGSYWTRWSEAKSRYRVALAGASGWASRPVNPWMAL